MTAPSDDDLQAAAVFTYEIVSAQKLEDGEHGEAGAVITELPVAGYQLEKFLEGLQGRR